MTMSDALIAARLPSENGARTSLRAVERLSAGRSRDSSSMRWGCRRLRMASLQHDLQCAARCCHLGIHGLAATAKPKGGGPAGHPNAVQHESIDAVGQQRLAHVETSSKAIGIQAEEFGDHEGYRGCRPCL